MTGPANDPNAPARATGAAADLGTSAQSEVSGGDADRMDPAGPGTGGVPSGADGETAAREQLRKDLGERSAGSGTDDGAELEQDAALGETDDPQGGSIQEHGSRPT